MLTTSCSSLNTVLRVSNQMVVWLQNGGKYVGGFPLWSCGGLEAETASASILRRYRSIYHVTLDQGTPNIHNFKYGFLLNAYRFTPSIKLKNTRWIILCTCYFFSPIPSICFNVQGHIYALILQRTWDQLKGVEPYIAWFFYTDLSHETILSRYFHHHSSSCHFSSDLCLMSSKRKGQWYLNGPPIFHCSGLRLEPLPLV